MITLITANPRTATSLIHHVRYACSSALASFCNDNRLAMDPKSVEVHPMGSLERWSSSATAYWPDGTRTTVYGSCDLKADGWMVAIAGGGKVFRFAAGEIFKWLRRPQENTNAWYCEKAADARAEKEGPMGFYTDTGRWMTRDERALWEAEQRLDGGIARFMRERMTAAEREDAIRGPNPHPQGDPAKQQPDGAMPPAADFSEVL